MTFVVGMNKKPDKKVKAYLTHKKNNKKADNEKERMQAEAEEAALKRNEEKAYNTEFLSLLEKPHSGQQNGPAPGSMEFLEQKLRQQNTAASVGFANSVTAPHRMAELRAEEARKEYETAKAREQYSGHAASVNMAAAAQPGSPYNLPRPESDELRALREQAEAAEAAAQRADQDYRLSMDRITYEQDMQRIQTLPADARSALETYARLYKSPRNSVTRSQYLNAKMALGRAGLSAEEMDALAETWTRHLNAERMAKAQADYAAMAEENNILHNVLSIPAGIVGGLTGTSAIIGEAIDRSGGSRYSTLDPNLPGYNPSVYTGTVREVTTENIDDGSALGKAGATLYGATMSAVDNLARIVTLGPTGSLAFAAMSSFQDSVRDVTNRGGTPEQAYAMGVATAGLEILTEKVSLDSLISTKTPENIVELLRNAAIQGGVEVSEEELNFAGGLIADAVIMGGNSQYERTVADLVAGGMPAEEAKRQAFMNNLSQAVNVAAQSFLSGGLMSGGQAGIQAMANGGFSAPQTAPAPVVGQNATPAEIPVQTAQTAPAQPAQEPPSRYVAPDGLRYEDMTPAQQMAADMEMAMETLKNRQVQTAPVENAEIQSAGDIADISPLWGKRTGPNNWGDTVSTAMEATLTALETAAPAYYREYISSAVNARTSPLIDAAIAAQEDVRQETISPMAAAVVLGETYSRRGERGLREMFNQRTGNLTPQALEQMKAVDASRAASYNQNQNNAPQIAEEGGNYAAGEVADRGVQRNSQNDPRGEAAGSPADGSRDAGSSAPFWNAGRRNPGTVYAQDTEGRAVTPDISVRLQGTAVTDQSGAPIAVYHATDNMEFDTFAKGDTGFHFGSLNQAQKRSKDKGFSQGRVFRAYLNIKNPIRARYDIMGWTPRGTALLLWGDGILSDAEHQEIISLWKKGDGYNSASAVRLREILESKGYDGIAYPNGFEGDGDSYIAFRDDQIVKTDISVFGVPSAPSGTVNPDESVGAAPQGFDPYTSLQYEYGNQPDRANDFRPVNVPKRDTYGRQVSEFGGNAYGAEAVPDSFIPVAEKLIVDGALGFDTRTNEESLNAAAKEIDSRGMAKAKADITKAVTSGKIGENDIAKAMLLFTHYANKGGAYAQDAAAELFVDLSQMATRAGRDLQLFKLLRKMTPQGQLQTVVRKVNRFVDQVNQTRSRKDQAAVEIPQDLQDEFQEAAREAADARASGDETAEKEAQRRADEAEQAIYQAAAAQIPGTLQEKWDAWRYMAMLGNPKTQIRNIIGNAAFRPFVSAKRFLNAAAQSMLKQQDRTVALLGFSEADNALRAFAAQDAKAQEQRMEYTGTTGDSATNDLQEQRKIFKNEALEYLRTKLSDLMGAEDMLFKRMEYRAALASYLKAKGVTASQLEAGEAQDILEAARSHAVQEAMKATFNDRNALSDFVVNLRYKGNNPVGKAMNALGEGILPFRRTPANIIARGLEYSPVNILVGVPNALTKVRSGEMSAADAIDQMSSTLVGTGALVLGYALASGIFGVRLVGAEDNEDDKRVGHQSYALEIGNISYTVDWAAPSNLPLFMGANLYAALNSEDRGTDVSAFTALLDVAANTLEPMLELSCLSSLNDLYQDIRYADEGREVYSVLASTATGYFLQGIPTLLGQIEQATETEKKSVYAESSDPVIGEVQRVLGRATQKIPGIDLYQAERVDEWGRTDSKNPILRAAEAFASPGYTSQIKGSAVEAELRRLNLAQDLNVSPRTASKTVTVGGKEVRLTAEQWEQVQTTQGQTAHRIVSDLTSSPDYRDLTDAEKASVIRSAYDYAREHARVSHVDGYDAYSAKWMEGIENSEAATILDRAKADAVGFSDARYATAKELGISFQDMQTVSAAVGDPDSKYDAFRAVLESVPTKDREAWLSVYGMTDSQLEAYREAVSGGLKPADYVGYLESVSAIDGAITKAVDAWNSGSLADPAALETAWKAYSGLSDAGKKYFLENAGGRTEAFVRAREAGISNASFLAAYDTYRTVSNGPGSSADKAVDFAAALDNMVRSGKFTGDQRQVLWDSLGYYASIRQDAQKYHDLTAEGLSPDTATHLLDSFAALKPESGYSDVRDIQKLEAIVSDPKLSDKDEEAALRAYLTPAAEDKLDAVLDMDLTAEAYVNAYRMYLNESGTGKKARTIAAYMEKFGLSEEEAKALYEIYG